MADGTHGQLPAAELVKQSAFRAFRNGLWNALSSIVFAVSSIIGSVLIVRSLSVEAYGAFSYYAWLAGLLSVLGILAFPVSLTKFTSELRGRREEGEARALILWTWVLLLCFNLLVSGAVVAWSLFIDAPERYYLLLVALVPLSNATTRILTSSLSGYENYRLISVTSNISAGLQLLLIVLSYTLSWGVAGYLFAVLSTNVTVPFILGALALLFDRSKLSLVTFSWPRRETLKRFLAFVGPSTLIVLVDAIVWQRSEIFFLERLSTLEQIGYYGLAYTLSSLFMGLGWALINGYYPAISHDFGADNWDGIREKIAQGMLLVALYAIPLTFGGFATIDELIALFYGTAMIPAAPVALILFAGLVPGVLGGLIGITFNALDRVWLMVGFGVFVAGLNIVLDLLLIPRLGAVGAAIANTVSQASEIFLLFLILQRVAAVSVPWRPLFRILFIAFLTAYVLPTVLEVWLTGPIGLIARIGLSVLSYGAIVWGFGYLTPLGVSSPSQRVRELVQEWKSSQRR